MGLVISRNFCFSCQWGENGVNEHFQIFAIVRKMYFLFWVPIYYWFEYLSFQNNKENMCGTIYFRFRLHIFMTIPIILLSKRTGAAMRRINDLVRSYNCSKTLRCFLKNAIRYFKNVIVPLDVYSKMPLDIFIVRSNSLTMLYDENPSIPIC